MYGKGASFLFAASSPTPQPSKSGPLAARNPSASMPLALSWPASASASASAFFCRLVSAGRRRRRLNHANHAPATPSSRLHPDGLSLLPGGGFAITRRRQRHRRSHVRSRNRSLHRWSHTMFSTEAQNRRVDEVSLRRGVAPAALMRYGLV